MLSVITLLGIAIPAVAVGFAVGVRAQRRRGGDRAGIAEGGDVSKDTFAVAAATVSRLRSQALEVAAEPVLIVGGDGRVRDCNAAALVLLGRHRTEVTEAEASTLRMLVQDGESPQDWSTVVARRAPWSGAAHVRLPDGSRSVVQARLVPVFGEDGDVLAMVEVYASPPPPHVMSRRGFLQVLDAGEPDLNGASPLEGARREVGLLALAFADMETVLRQYERLLPAMRAEDPMTEAMAGLAAETSEVATSANVPRLLEEIPRALARLRTRLEQQGAAGPMRRD